MNRKAVSLDLDGTLLDSSGAIGPRSVRMVAEVAERGWATIISTARPVRTILRIVPDWFRSFYWSACNGAWILNDGRIINRAEIPHRTASHLIELLRGRNTRFQVEAEDLMFSDCGAPPSFVGVHHPLSDLGRVDVCKIIVNVRSSEEVALIEAVLPSDCACVVTDGGTLAQISHATCDKLSAVEYILGREGLGLQDLIAFGDDNNDLSLIRAAGCGVAMGNATSQLKAAADHITLTSDEDGVGCFLESVLFPAGGPWIPKTVANELT